MSAVTQTITRTIVGINPMGNNVWQIEFNPAQTPITSDVYTSPVIYYSSSALPVILNPFLNNISNFNNSDYNAIINNANIIQKRVTCIIYIHNIWISEFIRLRNIFIQQM